MENEPIMTMEQLIKGLSSADFDARTDFLQTNMKAEMEVWKKLPQNMALDQASRVVVHSLQMDVCDYIAIYSCFRLSRELFTRMLNTFNEYKLTPLVHRIQYGREFI